jgi:hypothetical protein
MFLRMLGAAALAASGLHGWAQSPGMDTGWLELVKGHRGDKVGAEVRDVRRDPATGERYVTVAIPKGSMADDSVMEEVRVVGRRPDKVEIDLPEFETEWVDDYDNDNYGLLVRLKDGPETPIRLFFNAAGQGGVMGTGAQP